MLRMRSRRKLINTRCLYCVRGKVLQIYLKLVIFGKCIENGTAVVLCQPRGLRGERWESGHREWGRKRTQPWPIQDSQRHQSVLWLVIPGTTTRIRHHGERSLKWHWKVLSFLWRQTMFSKTAKSFHGRQSILTRVSPVSHNQILNCGWLQLNYQSTGIMISEID